MSRIFFIFIFLFSTGCVHYTVEKTIQPQKGEMRAGGFSFQTRTGTVTSTLTDGKTSSVIQIK